MEDGRWEFRDVPIRNRGVLTGMEDGRFHMPYAISNVEARRWMIFDRITESPWNRSHEAARTHHKSSATNDPSPAYRLIRSSPCETVGARARLDELLHLPGLQVNYSNLAARITRDVCHRAIRADQHLLRRAWHLERAGHLHRL